MIYQYHISFDSSVSWLSVELSINKDSTTTFVNKHKMNIHFHFVTLALKAVEMQTMRMSDKSSIYGQILKT